MGQPLQKLQRFVRELKRRNVYKVAATYAVVAFVGFQAAKLLIPSTVLPTWADELILAFLIVGFPVSLVVAWAFEMTPEGVRRTPEDEPAEEGASEAGGGLSTGYKVLVGLGLVGAAVVGGWYLTGGGGGEEGERTARSIAVLPFESMGGEESAQLSLGVHDGLLTRLSNVSDLQVISRTSVLQYEKTEKTIPEIARELDARWIVEGAVQQAGGQVQVNAQLIKAPEDAHQWAQSYNRELTPENLFAIQSELTKKIARSLEAELTPEEERRVERRPTENLAAYRLYVQGRTELDERTETGMRKAVEYFQGAISQDSTYALAWSGLADARMLLAFYGYASRDSMHPRASDAARRALELDPRLAEAHASMGFLYRNYYRNAQRALRELQRAVELRPSYARAHHWLGNSESTLGRPERALERLRTAAELDPRSPPIQASLAWDYWWVEGPGKKALAHARRTVELEPGYAHGHAVQGLILSDAGRQEQAVAAFREALELEPVDSYDWVLSLAGLGVAHARRGDTVRARELLDRLQRQGSAPFNEAMLQAALGEASVALRTLQNVEWSAANVWALRLMPVFDPLRDDPRYRKLIRKINRQWGLNPDGSLPDSVDVSFEAQ